MSFCGRSGHCYQNWVSLKTAHLRVKGKKSLASGAYEVCIKALTCQDYINVIQCQ